MCAVQIRVYRDHLRFKPESELHAEAVNFLGEFRKAADLTLIHLPVAKARIVVVSMAEPSVVQNQHLDSELLRLFCERVDFLPIKVKICRLPVVDQDGARLLFPGAPNHMSPDEIVIVSCHPAKPLAGIGADHLRCRKGLPGPRFQEKPSG